MLKPAPKAAQKKKTQKFFTMKTRAGIVVSIVFPILTAFLMKPWQDKLIPYICIGILPVALAWGMVWILAAQKKQP